MSYAGSAPGDGGLISSLTRVANARPEISGRAFVFKAWGIVGVNNDI
ncbi:hypothetical protein DDI_4042 [Dickeya dianthicola RNS04.9]|nr:hypothetical protein DDI_4042 [Dickeya dianthicola RNS04.9]